MNLFFVFYMFLFSLISLVLIRKHILLCLLSIEFIIISMLFMMMIYCVMFMYNMYIYMMFMILFVCEGVLGLSVLVCMIRSHGNDFANSMFMW
uniref:NADH dehydrogenase subunit 4L n=1 Tax=Busonia albilateralis TaxID=2479888 RepID=UPI0024116700|nr:NADH dehydrogenase subunit 4L [Busonia albilateralis]WEP24819.1 NADH dehydrogenase subunit 4L [Busonia albilateralis]